MSGGNHERVILSVIGALALIVGTSIGVSVVAQEADEETATVVSDSTGEGTEGHLACTLSLFPATVTNGEVFTAFVGFSPSIEEPHFEDFMLLWPSTSPTFTEATLRRKVFKSDQAISGSSEKVVTPAATFINGTFDGQVRVMGVGGLICTASATMTVS